MIEVNDTVIYKGEFYTVIDSTGRTLALERIIDGQRVSVLIDEVKLYKKGRIQ